MYDHGELKLQLVRQLLHEGDEVLGLLAMVVLDCPRELVKHFMVDLVVFLYTLQGVHLLLKSGFSGVVACDNRRQGTRCEREGHHTDKHEEDAVAFLCRILSANVTVAHCYNGCHGEVE